MSLGRSKAGAAVILQFTPISLAKIRDMVVLPNPGGPYSSRWSKDSCLPWAAAIAILRIFFNSFCPI